MRCLPKFYLWHTVGFCFIFFQLYVANYYPTFPAEIERHIAAVWGDLRRTLTDISKDSK